MPVNINAEERANPALPPSIALKIKFLE